MENTFIVCKRIIGELLTIEDKMICTETDFEKAVGKAAIAAHDCITKKLMEAHPNEVVELGDDEIEVFYYIVKREGKIKPLYATEMYFRYLNKGAN